MMNILIIFLFFVKNINNINSNLTNNFELKKDLYKLSYILSKMFKKTFLLCSYK